MQGREGLDEPSSGPPIPNITNLTNVNAAGWPRFVGNPTAEELSVWHQCSVVQGRQSPQAPASICAAHAGDHQV